MNQPRLSWHDKIDGKNKVNEEYICVSANEESADYTADHILCFLAEDII
jgi:hypothetical protein